MRNAVIISIIVSLSTVGLQLVFVSPIMFFLLRALDGFCLALFWVNLQAQISLWQENDVVNAGTKYFSYYGLSWNLGILFGQVTGFIIVLGAAGLEFFAMIFSWITMFSMLPAVLVMEKNNIPSKLPEVLPIASDRQRLTIPQPHSKNERVVLLAFPAIFYLIGTMIYAYIKNYFPLIYPLYLKSEGIASYWVYLITFFHQLLQTIIIFTISKKSVKTGYYLYVFNLAANIFLAFLLFVNPSILLLSFCFIFSGVLSAFGYNMTSKIMLEYGSAHKSSKYASFYEFFNGIGFGLSPLLIGFVAEIGLMWNHLLLGILTLFIGSILLFLSRNAWKIMKQPNVTNNS
jgi:MFS family permease